MKIHEYQAKAILAKFGVPVPRGQVVSKKDEARAVAERLGTPVVVVKAQIHAGGRGKGGGVKVAQSAEEAAGFAEHILGMNLVTAQTGPEGRIVRRVLVEEGLDIQREIYLSVLVDRAVGAPVFMASAAGGMDIEEVAKNHPEKILRETVRAEEGFQAYHARKLAFGLGLSADLVHAAVPFMTALYRAFVETDSSLLEINPCVVTGDGRLVALDAKINFDDNALYRHPELEAWRDPNEEDAQEIEAKKWDLSYISLDGNIGCMVNGAGLAMSTMDIIKFYGGAPANFLDVGGGATAEKVTAAFKIITASPDVKAIFVNIFGGIMKCDTIAAGVIAAVKEVGLKVPLVVRLEGTNVELGKKMLAESKLNIVAAADMADGAKKVVAAAGGSK
jgi:succinyl-CoA synthetase beta subunit